ncbi:hypothetical protein AQUCO_03000159v1 [Aquilegia coerulea]|uniref:Uncharacterized protein n=1 Tax=Aquilegia coerulea TaxID=218851 RepID=A0A2G5D1I0_AQUCA|nr:hypothetical protein AQUCO_03000159v1 [Aquilegia coerulea]
MCNHKQLEALSKVTSSDTDPFLTSLQITLPQKVLLYQVYNNEKNKFTTTCQNFNRQWLKSFSMTKYYIHTFLTSMPLSNRYSLFSSRLR